MPSARYPHTAKVGVSYYCIVQITGPDMAPLTAGRMGDRLARKGLIHPPRSPRASSSRPSRAARKTITEEDGMTGTAPQPAPWRGRVSGWPRGTLPGLITIAILVGVGAGPGAVVFAT